jgi:sigma-B regulation protein RsbU (phosphoserine phosphatase)
MFQILIIDDDRIVQLTLTRILEKQGYEVLTANNGEEGIAQAQQCRPALIICDWLMPRLMD